MVSVPFQVNESTENTVNGEDRHRTCQTHFPSEPDRRKNAPTPKHATIGTMTMPSTNAKPNPRPCLASKQTKKPVREEAPTIDPDAVAAARARLMHLAETGIYVREPEPAS